MKHRQAPNLVPIEKLLVPEWAWVDQQEINGKWYPARPLGMDTIGHRLKCAWLVFTGKYDVLVWPEDTNKETE